MKFTLISLAFIVKVRDVMNSHCNRLEGRCVDTFSDEQSTLDRDGTIHVDTYDDMPC
jgi:hypothetical protein